MSEAHPDRIEKKILLRAPRSRVWRALTDSGEFGHWFGVKFDGPFAPGRAMRGVHGRHQGRRGGGRGATAVQRPAVRDHDRTDRARTSLLVPLASVPPRAGADYSSEPTTLVEFALEEVSGGVMLTVTESGFDRVPLARRAQGVHGQRAGLGHDDRRDRAVCHLGRR